MKTRTVIERVGELLGPVDWSYDFRSHYEGMGVSPERRDAECEKDKENLRLLEEHPELFEATTDGGWPRFGWQRIVAVGMYDGWPYWRPVPSVCLAGPLGTEWHPFNSITDIAELKDSCK